MCDCLLLYEILLLLCPFLSDFGGYYRRHHGTCLFSLDSFLSESVFEIRLEQLHISFVTDDITGEVLHLGLRVFYLVLVLTCCMTLGTACHRCMSLWSLNAHLPISSLLDATFFWAGTSFPDTHTHTL